MQDIILIGAGLCGLTLAYELEQKGFDFVLLEARDRPGGRVHTSYTEAAAPLELGATWLGSKHTALVGLLARLDLPVFEQYMGETVIYEPISTSPPQLAQLPPNTDPSYRIAGGSSALTARLCSLFDENRLHLNTVVQTIYYQDGACRVTTNQGTFVADKVISTVPPRLLSQKIDLYPALSRDLVAVAEQTHTWMGESIKVGLRYGEPFWRKPGNCGSIFSNVGPVSEMYDHSDEGAEYYALKGFLNGSFHAASPAYRRDLVLQQLARYFGDQVYDFLDYEECVWSQEPHTYTPYDGYMLPHQHNGHAVFRQAFWDGHLYLAGSETAEAYPGYMDGAVRSAAWVLSQLIQRQ